LVIDLPGSIQELSDFHASFSIGSAQRSGGNIQEQFSQAYGIIQSHFGRVVETNGPVHIECFGDGAPSFLGLAGGIAKRRLNRRKKVGKRVLPSGGVVWPWPSPVPPPDGLGECQRAFQSALWPEATRQRSAGFPRPLELVQPELALVGQPALPLGSNGHHCA
jgi:hypothetical protein